MVKIHGWFVLKCYPYKWCIIYRCVVSAMVPANGKGKHYGTAGLHLQLYTQAKDSFGDLLGVSV